MSKHSPRPKTRGHLRDARILFGTTVFAAVCLLAILAPVVTQYPPEQVHSTARLQGPSSVHWLGTDDLGRDIFSNIAYGAQTSLVVSAASILVASTIGIPIGLMGGLTPRLGFLLMRAVDFLLAFPPILIAIFFASLLSPSTTNLIIVIGILQVPRLARVVYSTTLMVKEQAYVEAAIALGCSFPRLMFRHVLPNVVGPVFVQVSLGLGQALLMESGLSYLGLGPPPPHPSWGRLVARAQRFISLSPYGVLWPSLFISATVIALNVLGDGLRDRLDPRLRRGRA